MIYTLIVEEILRLAMWVYQTGNINYKENNGIIIEETMKANLVVRASKCLDIYSLPKTFKKKSY